MLLCLSIEVIEHWSVPCESDERPVRCFPQTWSFCSFAIGSGCPLLTATEEFSLLTVLMPRACTGTFGDALVEFEDRVEELLYHARFHEGLRFTSFAMARMTDDRIAGHAAQRVSRIQCISRIVETLVSPLGARSVEESISSRPLEFLSGQSPCQAFLQASRGEPLRGANWRQHRPPA